MDRRRVASASYRQRPLGRGGSVSWPKLKASGRKSTVIFASAGAEGDSCRRHAKGRSASHRIDRAVPISFSAVEWWAGFVDRALGGWMFEARSIQSAASTNRWRLYLLPLRGPFPRGPFREE